MVRKKQTYVSYLLRLRQVTSPEGVMWRASLEEPSTGQHYRFASLDSLFHFLRLQTEECVETTNAPQVDMEQLPF